MACTTALRQLLMSFCTNSPWTYAVLWKLRHQNPMILTWEDGYCVHQIARESVESLSSDAYHNYTEIIPSNFEISMHEDCFGAYPIDKVVTNMSHLNYTWGEGVVGKVAYTGKHCWVSYDDIFSDKAILERPEEWLLQFASGIKTIVLVPVLPHGVLQLGSLEMVDKDLSFSSYIKERFACKNIHDQLPYSLITGLLEKLESSSSGSIGLPNSEDSNAVDSVKPNKLFNLDQIAPLSSIQNAFKVPGIDLLDILDGETEKKINIPPVSISDASLPLSQSGSSNQRPLGNCELGFSCLEEELLVYPECNAYSVGECGEILDEVTNPYLSRYTLERPFGDFSIDNAGFLNFPEDFELNKALGPAFERQGNPYICESFFEPPLSTKGDGAEYLLQAVVGHAHDGSVDIANRSNCFMTSPGQLPLSSRPQSIKADSTPLSRLTSASVGVAKNNSSSDISASSKSAESTLTDNGNVGKDHCYTQSRKGRKQLATKKKDRPGDKPRSRPRDRQMIQDRLKELRELVPDGAKYSIDALLDQTVKHMLYLRSVTNQAEKLRQWVHHEMSGRKNMRSSKTKDGNQTGTSWAFEIGDEFKICPIVVEDLAHPGHLVIEMLCNEPGLFLEIAQVIRSFNLTILKGVMETCSNNTWAHFIVEASKGFHRLDIFWPLMQLLQRQRNPTSNKI